MNRAAKYSLAALLAAALIGAGVWGAWLVGTEDGARWTLDRLSRHTPLAVSARQVEGRLLDRLHLGGVRISRPPYDVEIDRLDCSWRPLLLFSGSVALQELTLTGVRIQDNTPAEVPPDLTWPRLSRLALLLGGGVGRLRVNGLDYRLLDGAPLHLDTVSSSVSWRMGILALPDLAAASPAGRISGNIAAGFGPPSLEADLAVTPSRAVAGMDAFSLQGRFHPGRGTEQLAGRLALTGSKGKTNLLELSGEAGMDPNAVHLRRLRLTAPGRRGSLAGGGSVTWSGQATLLALQMTADGLDLSPELGAPTDLSGTLTLTGTPKLYQGDFRLANRGKGWKTASLSGSYRGDGSGVKLAALNGSLLAGSVQGNLDLAWDREVSVKGTLRGRNLDPAGISPDWAGVVSFDIAGGVSWPDLHAPPRAEVSGRLLESRLHGQPLTGEFEARSARGDLSIGRLALRGKGFDIRAAGTLSQRLEFNARITDLGRLIPRTAGELRADGWVRWRDGRLDGAASGRGGNLAAGGLRVAAADWAARLGEQKGHPLHVAAKLHRAAYDGFQVDSLTVEADGTVLRHTAQAAFGAAGAEARISLEGGYERGSWRGRIVRLSGRDRIGPWSLEAPASLAVSAGHLSLSPLALAGVHPERIEIAGEMTAEPLGGSVRVTWDGLNPARANPWLSRDLQLDGRLSGRAAADILPGKQLDITGQTSWVRGRIRLSRGTDALDADISAADLSWRWRGTMPASAAELAAGRLALSGRIGASGVLTVEGRRIALERGSLHLDGSERGLNARVDLTLAGGGAVKGAFSSAAPARLELPEAGDLTADWTGIPPELFRPWLPPALHPEGLLSGRAAGSLLPGRRLSLKGDAAVSGGKIRWSSPEGEIRMNLRSASARWDWQGEALRGDVSLTLMEHGEARGNFRLPIPARLPAALNRQGPLQGSITVQVLEKGLLSALFPGFIRESRGEVDADLQVGGTWEEPRIGGSLRLSKAGAYLPTAGIHVGDVRLAMRIEKELLHIDSFRAVSGPGHVEGTALVRMKGWRMVGYSGSVGGERFQLVYFPELQIQGSPRLTFEGTAEKLAIRGEMHLPELLIIGPPTRAVVLPSRDVILEGTPKPPPKASPLALDVQVRLTLGDRVLVKLEGIDAQLGGGIDLTFQSLEKIASKGEIRVVRGRYKAYGVDLEIARGRLYYAGGPINQPTLDILALRTVGEVRAGVTAGGILRAPVVKLYSEPAMPDVDILAYIVFGRPLGSSSTNAEQAGMMAQVAGVLLSRGQSVVLQEQIKNRLGLSTLEIQSGATGASGRMGYKEIPAAPAGVAPASQTSGLSQTMLTVGKYLTPELYFSYGRSLFTGGNLFRLRYDLSRRWQIETQTGSESGADLYFKIEFD